MSHRCPKSTSLSRNSPRFWPCRRQPFDAFTPTSPACCVSARREEGIREIMSPCAFRPPWPNGFTVAACAPAWLSPSPREYRHPITELLIVRFLCFARPRPLQGLRDLLPAGRHKGQIMLFGDLDRRVPQQHRDLIDRYAPQ